MSPRAFLATLALLSSLAGTALGQQDHSRDRPDDPHEAHRNPTAADEHVNHEGSQQTESERAHVPPDPPSLVLRDMSNQRMIELMQMEDDAALGMLRLDELEGMSGDDDGFAWDAHAWYGTDYDKLWLKSQGERMAGETTARIELLWDRIASAWWSVQAGVRHDVLEGPSRTWAAVGVQGLAPQLVHAEATLYVGEQGRTAVRLSVERDLLITQRLILQPQLELAAYGKDDPANGIGSGLSDVGLGLRLRYELIREIAPYVGVRWERKLGGTGDFARATGDDPGEMFLVAGLRAWF